MNASRQPKARQIVVAIMARRAYVHAFHPSPHGGVRWHHRSPAAFTRRGSATAAHVHGSEPEGLSFVERAHHCDGAGRGGQFGGQFLHLFGGDGLDKPQGLVDVLVFAGHQFGPAQA